MIHGAGPILDSGMRPGMAITEVDALDEQHEQPMGGARVCERHHRFIDASGKWIMNSA
jgi:hypothetical protein